MDIVDGSYNFSGYIYDGEAKCVEKIHIYSNPPSDKMWVDNGSYAAVVLDFNGAVIFDESFDVTSLRLEDEFSPSTRESYRYSLSMPYYTSAQFIKIFNKVNDELLCQYEFDPDQIEVDFISSPEGMVNEALTLDWDVTNVSEDDLSYTLEYSYDGGKAGTWWRIPLPGLTETHYTIDPDTVPGSVTSSVVRIIATDGVSHAVDTTTIPFYVPMKRPEVMKFNTNDTYYRHGVGGSLAVQLGGVDGDITPNDNITWHSNRDGMVGRGANYNGSNLSIGTHQIYINIEMLNGEIFSENITTVTVAGNAPVIELRVGDGKVTDLACNELEVNVRFPHVGMEKVIYSMGLNDRQPINEITGLSELPIRYQMIEPVRVYVFAVNRAGLSDRYNEIVELLDCEPESSEDQ